MYVMLKRSSVAASCWKKDCHYNFNSDDVITIDSKWIASCISQSLIEELR